MRKSKKILALIMTVIMSLSLISSAIVYAEPPVVTITVGTVAGTPGSQVVVPVNLSNLAVDGLVLTDIMLQYDDTKLQLDAITPAVKPAGVITTGTDLSQSVIDAKQGAGLFKLLYFDNAFAGTGTTHISTNGLFANLTFTVLSDGSSSIPITITADTIVGDIYENPYYIEQIGTVNGAVTFATATPAPTPTAVPIIKTALASKIADATTLFNSLVVGALEGQVTAQVKADLGTAITAAQDVNSSLTATQAQVDTAVTDLQTAMSAVVLNPPTPTPTPVPTYDITVTVDDTMGMVINSATYLAVKNGQKITVTEGTSLKLYVSAFGGHIIEGIVYDGGAVAGAGMYTYTVNTGAITANASLAVSFDTLITFEPPCPPIVDIFPSVIISGDAATSYGAVHGVTDAEILSRVVSCGIILWNTGDADVTLPQAFANQNDGIHVFSATTGASAVGVNTLGQFAVMVKNLPAGTYKMKTYVVKNNHVASYSDIVTFTIS